MWTWIKKLFGGGANGNGLEAKLGQHVVLKGVAWNAKAGAIIEVREQPVYIDGLQAWEQEQLGKRIRLSGVLQRGAVFRQLDLEDQGVMQGMSGEAFYIEDYKLL